MLTNATDALQKNNEQLNSGSQALKTKFCSECGTKNLHTAKFCSACGTKFIALEELLEDGIGNSGSEESTRVQALSSDSLVKDAENQTKPHINELEEQRPDSHPDLSANEVEGAADNSGVPINSRHQKILQAVKSYEDEKIRTEDKPQVLHGLSTKKTYGSLAAAIAAHEKAKLDDTDTPSKQVTKSEDEPHSGEEFIEVVLEEIDAFAPEVHAALKMHNQHEHRLPKTRAETVVADKAREETDESDSDNLDPTPSFESFSIASIDEHEEDLDLTKDREPATENLPHLIDPVLLALHDNDLDVADIEAPEPPAQAPIKEPIFMEDSFDDLDEAYEVVSDSDIFESEKTLDLNASDKAVHVDEEDISEEEEVEDSSYEANLPKQSKDVTHKPSKRELKLEKRRKLKELKVKSKNINKEVSKQKKTIRAQIKEKDKELAKRTRRQRDSRKRANNVYDAIAYNLMFKNGVCEVEEGLYSESIMFDDVSYQSSHDEAQRVTLKKLAAMLDYFDSDSMIQYWISNRLIPDEEIGTRVFFDPELAGKNSDKAEIYNKILNDKMREGCSNIVRQRVISYATSAENPNAAVRSLARIRQNIVSTLSSVKSSCEILNGEQRLELINSIVRPGKSFEFSYEKNLHVRSKLTTKDFICPKTLDFKRDDTCFKSEDMWCQVLIFEPNFASEITDRAISTIVDLPIPLTLSWHLHPLEKSASRDMVSTQSAWIQKEIIDKQKQALQGGWDYNLLPLELQDTKTENEALLEQIDHASQRLYYFTGFAFTYAKTREELDDQVVQIIRTAHSVGIEIGILSLQQREGLNSVLPLAHCHVDAARDFTTTEASILVPFTTQELDHVGGGYYGQNKISNNLVLCNRKKLMSPHGFISGMTRSGKSFAVKSEIENTILLNQEDEIYIFDITGEYAYITNKNGGTEFAFGPDAKNYCNPFDLTDVSEMSLQSALAWKTDAILAMTSALRSEGDEDLTQEERSVITAAVEAIYRKAFAEDRVPILEDFVNELSNTQGVGTQLGKRLALMYSRFVGNSPFNFLNNYSNIDFGQSRLTSFNYKEIPSDIRPFNIIANLENVRQRMLRNHAHGIRTWIYVDEIQALFAHKAIIDYLARLWREGAKYGLICTGMTQSASAMDAGGESSTIIEQSGFLLLLKQSDRDRRFWVEMKGLSPQEEAAIGDTVRPGQGLIIADGARVPITGDFPKGNVLYDMFNTSPEEYAHQQQMLLNG